jgi:hypothetical protein
VIHKKKQLADRNKNVACAKLDCERRAANNTCVTKAFPVCRLKETHSGCLCVQCFQTLRAEFPTRAQPRLGPSAVFEWRATYFLRT